jgi:hypothetical protein
MTQEVHDIYKCRSVLDKLETVNFEDRGSHVHRSVFMNTLVGDRPSASRSLCKNYLAERTFMTLAYRDAHSI